MTATLEPSELLAAEPVVLTNIRIGYARVSTAGQKLERQIDALRAAVGISPGTLYNHIPDLRELRAAGQARRQPPAAPA